MPSGNKLLPEPVLTKIPNAIWHHQATICEGLNKNDSHFAEDFSQIWYIELWKKIFISLFKSQWGLFLKIPLTTSLYNGIDNGFALNRWQAITLTNDDPVSSCIHAYQDMVCHRYNKFNSLRPSDAIWRHRSGSTLAQVMACCLTAPSHYLNQCWLIISKVEWHSS